MTFYVQMYWVINYDSLKKLLTVTNDTDKHLFMCSIKIIKSNFEELLWSIGQAKSICFTVSKFLRTVELKRSVFGLG